MIRNARVVTLVVFFVLALAGQARAQISASIAFDRTGDVSTDRLNVTLTGHYTCGPISESGFGSFSGALAQAAGRQVAETIFGIQTVCDGTQHSFQVDVPASNIPWHGGPARITGSLFVQDCSVFPCESAQSTVNVQVKLR
jgi:uncharacterized protein DUF6299